VWPFGIKRLDAHAVVCSAWYFVMRTTDSRHCVKVMDDDVVRATTRHHPSGEGCVPIHSNYYITLLYYFAGFMIKVLRHVSTYK